jgi:hypothetical protein
MVDIFSYAFYRLLKRQKESPNQLAPFAGACATWAGHFGLLLMPYALLAYNTAVGHRLGSTTLSSNLPIVVPPFAVLMLIAYFAYVRSGKHAELAEKFEAESPAVQRARAVVYWLTWILIPVQIVVAGLLMRR